MEGNYKKAEESVRLALARLSAGYKAYGFKRQV